MATEERTAFEDKLAADPTLQQQVKDVEKIFSDLETAALKTKLDDFHEQIPANSIETKPKLETDGNYSSKSIYLAMAAVFVLAFGTTWFFMSANGNQKLFDKHFSADPGLPTVMSQESNFEFYDGMVNYKRSEYKTAIDKWEVLLLEKPNNDTLNYFLGVAYLAEGNSEKSIDYLEKITRLNSSTFEGEAYYYLALAQLKEGSTETVKQILQQHPSEKTNALLTDLIKLSE